MENIKIHCPRGYQKQSIYNGNIADATLQSENKHTKTKLIRDLSHIHTYTRSLSIFGTRSHTYSLVTKRTSAYKPAVSHPAQSQICNPDSAHLKLVSWLAGSNKPLPPQLSFSKAAARVTVVMGWPRPCSCTRASFFCSHSVTRLLSSAALYPIRVLRSHTNL